MADATHPQRVAPLPIRQDRFLPRPYKVKKCNQDSQSRDQPGELEQYGLVQTEGSLHKYRAYEDDRGGDAKNFQAIVSHTQSVGR